MKSISFTTCLSPFSPTTPGSTSNAHIILAICINSEFRAITFPVHARRPYPKPVCGRSFSAETLRPHMSTVGVAGGSSASQRWGSKSSGFGPKTDSSRVMAKALGRTMELAGMW